MTITDLSHPSSRARPLDASKRDDLARELAAAAQAESAGTPEGWAMLVDRERHRYAVLVDVLSPDGPLAAALSAALAKRQAELLPGAVPSEQQDAIARQEMLSILNNRRDDAVAAGVLLRDAAWIERVKRGIGSGEIIPPTGTETLSVAKQADEREQLLGHLPVPEPAVHIQFSAMGHRLGHLALADVFSPGGEAAKIFLAEMQRRLPGEVTPALESFDTRWLALRSHRAGLTAELLQSDSPFVQETIAEGERRRALPMSPATALPTLPPVAQIPNTLLREPQRSTWLGRVKQHLFGNRPEELSKPSVSR